MARRPFGGTPADLVQDRYGNARSGVAVTFWTAKTGGTQVTDIQTAAGGATSPAGTIVTGSDGVVEFLGPDDGTAALWADAGSTRVLMLATDDPSRMTALESGSATTAALTAEIDRATAAEALLIPLTQKGAASGVASLDGSGTVPDAQIPASIARDAETTAAVAAHAAAADPHPVYMTAAEVSGSYASVLGCPNPSGDITGATDRAAIQAVINSAASFGVKYVQLQTATAASPYWLNTVVSAADSNYQCALYLPSGVTLRGQGMDATTLKLAANAVGLASGKGSNLIVNQYPTVGTDTGVRCEDFTLDGNAANQTDSFNGIAFIRGRAHGTTKVRVKNVRGTASSGANETFQFMVNGCADVRQVGCEAVGDAGTTASGFASNGATNLVREGCTARGMSVSQGFTDYRSSLVSNVGCVAYGNGQAGFNGEDCDQITWSGCHSGGKAALAADGYPFAAGATLPANQNGFVVNGCNRFSLQGSTGRYNTNAGLALTNNYTTLSGTVDGGSYSDNAIGINAAVAVTAVTIGPTTECLRNTTAQVSLLSGYTDLHGPLGSPAMPGSNSTFTNPYPVDVIVTIGGGTVTDIQVNGPGAMSYGAIVSGSFPVPAGGSIKIIYSVAPTWYWSAL